MSSQQLKANRPHIQWVKKYLANGELCGKCADVEARVRSLGIEHIIDEVLIADERDPHSSGQRLASELGVTVAPFFVVTENRKRVVYTVFFRFLKAVFPSLARTQKSSHPQLQARREETAEASALLHAHPELDFI